MDVTYDAIVLLVLVGAMAGGPGRLAVAVADAVAAAVGAATATTCA